MKDIVCVTGFGWSGSGAVFDLLREYEDVDILDLNGEDFEFTLLFEKDGICDLDFGLNINNSRINSSAYISRFLNMIDYLSEQRGYDEVFNGKFRELSKSYIDNLVDFTFEGWTFEDLRNPLKQNRKKNIYNSVIRHIFDNRITTHSSLSKRIKNRLTLKVTHPIRVSYFPKDFVNKTIEYMDSLFESCHPHSNKPLIVDQLFTPENPERLFKYCNQPKCIIVRRDPRDTYLLAKCALSHDSVALPVDNVYDYVSFYRDVIANTKRQDSETILSINFEDLIYDYDNTVEIIERFIGIKKHGEKKKYFNPEISINNTQLFTKYKDYSTEIDIISKELSSFLYCFKGHEFKRTSTIVF